MIFLDVREVITFGLIKIPGDVDKDGEEDGVIAMTLLSPLFLHLLLAVVAGTYSKSKKCWNSKNDFIDEKYCFSLSVSM